MRAPAAFLFALLLAAAADASAGQTWLAGSMTDAGPHPRTLFSQNDLPVIRDRLTRAPYVQMLASVQSQADREVPLDDHSKNNETQKAAIAKACSFLYAIDRRHDAVSGSVVPFDDEASRRAYAEKAARYLLSMYAQSLAKGLNADAGLGTAEALHMWSQAYDLLVGGGFDFVEPEGNVGSAVVQNVADLAADLWADYMVQNIFILRGYLNNHRSKAAAALGMAAIALNGAEFSEKNLDGQYRLENWVDFAMRYLDLVLMSLETDQEGTYQESGGYYAYTAVNHVPFFRAWNRYTGAAPYMYAPWTPDKAPYYVVSMTEPYTVNDFWTNPAFHAQLDYLWKTMLPDRTAPPFDDCTPGVSFPWGWVVDPALPNAPVYRWAWESSPQGLAHPGLVGAADTIVAFDDSIAPSAPLERPDTVLPIAGNVVFRQSWETDANVVVINAEHGNAGARTYTRWGDAFDGLAGHEHLEPASFMVCAGREPLIIDSGYLGWPNHGKVNNPHNHNILLVDGKGPQMPAIVVPDSHSSDAGYVLDEPWREGGWTLGADGDAYLVDSYVSEHMKIAIVKTRYEAAGGFEWTRRFVWIDDRYLVVYDEFEARDGKDHEVRFLLHGNGGGTSGGQYEEIPQGALWTQAESRVRALVLSDSPVEYSTTIAIHDRWQWDERTHSVLNTIVNLPAGETGRFMAVFAIEKADGGTQEGGQFEVGAGSVAWETEGVQYHAAVGKAETAERDADLFVLRAQDLWGDWQFYAKAAREIWFGSGPVPSFLISGGPEVFLGSNQEKDDVIGNLFEPSPDGGGFAVGGFVSGGTGICSLENEGDRTRVNKPGRGPFTLSLDAGPAGVVAAIEMIPSREFNPFHPALEVLTPVTLSGAKSCDPNGGALSYSWRIVMKPELSAAGLSASSAIETGFAPDLPGSYRIELEVSSNGVSDVASVLLHVEGDVREARAAMDGGTEDAEGQDEGREDEGREDDWREDDGREDEGREDEGTRDAGAQEEPDTGRAAAAGGCGCALLGV
jgi:hypothetical protein